MCLPDFKRFERIKKENAVTGYRMWILDIKNPSFLKSINTEYFWKNPIGRHKVTEKDSGLYSYNNNYYHNNNYYILGIIKQYGKVAIHKTGYRSERAYIDTLFTINKTKAQGPKEFLNWIDKFNALIEEKAKYYKCKTIPYQDFLDNTK